MQTFPEHTIERDALEHSVWHLMSGGEIVASFTTFCATARGGVFCIKTGKGWTLEMADRAFRVHMGEQLT